MFLMKTKNQDDFVLQVVQWMGYTNHLTVPPQGLSGGLVLLWKEDVNVKVISSSPNFIETKAVVKGKMANMTFVYSHPTRSMRKDVLDKISENQNGSDLPWILMGDFNDIVGNEEKRGGPPRNEGSFSDFRSFLSRNGLFDICHSGNPLSWRGMRYSHFIWSRLDRSLANNSWFEMFPSGRSHYLRFEGSDHRPLITYLDGSRRKKRGRFRFDNRLGDNEEIRELIETIWEQEGEAPVASKLNSCRRAIIEWTKERNQNSVVLIEATRVDLEKALSSDPPDIALISTLTTTLEKAYKDEERFWKQRSKVLWLQSGDRNTGYFHAMTRNRRAMNRFSVIETSTGVPHHEENQIVETIESYFTNIFKAGQNVEYKLVQEALEPIIIEKMNDSLTAIPEEEEIKAGLFSIHPSKARDLMDFSQVFSVLIGILLERKLLEKSRDFSLQEPSRVEVMLLISALYQRFWILARFPTRPIALCNVYYKIVAKILTKRLQSILPNIISENQSAFVPERAILDNVLITHEILHYLRLSKAHKRGAMAIKTDMSKAYDRIEWGFLEAALRRLGFASIWVQWILECVTTVTYSFLVNGSPQGQVTPTRGLRPGDPLSLVHSMYGSPLGFVQKSSR